MPNWCRLKRFIVAATILLVSFLAFGVNAAFNPEINYQGKLFDKSDNPVENGEYKMIFELFTSSTGGTAIWTENRSTSNNVTVTSGLFSVMLGEVNALTSVDFNQPLYLQVSIGTSTPEVMSPRKKLGAVPAAFEAQKLDGHTWGSPGAIGSDSASTGVFTNATTTGMLRVIGNSYFGDIASGTWSGTAIGASHGGTGVDSSGWTGFAFVNGGTWTSTSTIASSYLDEADPIWTAISNSLTVSNFATNTVSQWYNDAGYITGYTTSAPAGLTGEVQFNDGGAFGATSSFFWDNVNARLGIGTTTPSAKVHVISGPGDEITIDAPSNLQIMETYDGEGNYTADALAHNLRVYAFKQIGSVTIFSSSYATLGSDWTDDGSSNTYYLEWAWDAVPGADGYRILKYETDRGFNYDYYRDVTTNYFLDNRQKGWTDSPVITPTSAYGPAKVATFGYDESNYVDAKISSDSSFGFYNNTGYGIIYMAADGKVGIQTDNPQYMLDVVGDVNIPEGSSYRYNGVNLAYAQTDLSNYFFGNSGNSTMIGTSNIAFGYNALSNNYDGADNTAIGNWAMSSNGSGSYNTAVGEFALTGNDGGFYNTAVGYNAHVSGGYSYYNTAVGAYALNSNYIGYYNIAIGYNSMYGNQTASGNTGIGSFALEDNISASNNTAIGQGALTNLLDGGGNIAIGAYAGAYQADGLTDLTGATNSIYIGNGARGYDNNDTNAIVIGDSAIGLGSNIVVLGNDSILKTILKGNVGIGDASPLALLTVGDGDKLRVDANGNLSRINDVPYSWPAAQGGTGSLLQDDGFGNLSWVATSSLGLLDTTTSPAGSNKQLQFNDNGSFGGAATANNGLYWDSSTSQFGVGTSTPSSFMEIYNAQNSNTTLSLTSVVSNRNAQIRFRNLADGTTARFTAGLYNGTTDEFRVSIGDQVNANNVFGIKYNGSSYFNSDLTVSTSLSVGLGGSFAVNNEGNIAKIYNLNYIWPSAHGASGTLFTQDGNGVLSWVSTSSLGFVDTDTTTSPAGSNGEIQFNDSGVFGATSAFYWDNTNARLGINTTSPSAKVHLITGPGSTVTVDTPTNLVLAETYDVSGNYQANYYTHNIRVYAYKDVGSTRIFSSSYATLGSDWTDDGSTNYYYLDWSWDAVTGADGYRIVKYETDRGYNYDRYRDVTSNAVTDNRQKGWLTPVVVTPTSATNIPKAITFGQDESNFVDIKAGSDSAFGFYNSAGGILYMDAAGQVGINTAEPEFALDIEGGSADSGIIARGTYGVGNTLTTSGEGTRMIWYPLKASFLAGYVNSDQWDDANLGSFSAAFGTNNRIAGSNSIIAGENNMMDSASYYGTLFGSNNSMYGAYNSFIAGGNNIVGESGYGGGSFSAVFGTGNRVDYGANYAVVGGGQNTVYGQYGTAFGNNNDLYGDYGAVFGYYNDIWSGTANFASGQNQSINGNYSAVVGGLGNTVNSNNGFIGGGYNNFLGSGSSYSFIGGGQYNDIWGVNAVAFGYDMNVNGNYSFGINASTTGATIDNNNVIGLLGGNVGIGDTSPLALLTVGDGDKLRVDANGNLSRINDVPYSWPAAQGGTGSLLQDDGFGNLSWVATSSLGIGGGVDTTTSPAGTNGQVQFNNGGVFGASADLYWDNTLGSLFVGSSNSMANATNSAVIGSSNSVQAPYSFVAGENNQASGERSFVAGGFGNNATAGAAFVGGGFYNTASGALSFVGGGQNNTASVNYATVVGGMANTVDGSLSIISGGSYNYITSANAFIGGGQYNYASGAGSKILGSYVTTSAGNSIGIGYGFTNNGLYSVGINVSSTNNPTITQHNTIALLGGNVGVGTVAPSYPLSVVGDIDISGTYRIGGFDYGQYFIDSAGTSGTLWVSDGVGRGYWIPTSSLGFSTSNLTGSGTSTQVAFWSGTNSLSSSSSLYWDNTNGRLGINNASPSFALTLGVDGGILATGTMVSGATLPITGTGARMIWYPRKAAFRAGNAGTDSWNDANIGFYSAAFGEATYATGSASFAAGYTSRATGDYAVALGRSSVASYTDAVAIGSYNIAGSIGAGIAIGVYNTTTRTAVAIGGNNNLDANSAVALGYNNTINTGAYYSNILGVYNTVQGYRSSILGSYNTANGSNTFIIGENNTSTPNSAYRGGVMIGFNNYSDGNSGPDNFIIGQYNTTSLGASEYNYVIGRYNNVDYSASNHVFGDNNSITGSGGTSNNNYILGSANTVGISSLYSAIVGRQNWLTNDSDTAFVLGASNTVRYSKAGSGAIGYFNYANSAVTGSIAIGTLNTMQGDSGALALGYSNTVSGNYGAVAIGSTNNLTANTSFALGQNITVTKNNAIGIGQYLTMSGTSSVGINVSSTSQTVSAENVIALLGGNVGINTTSPAFTLSVAGDLAVTGTIRVGNSLDAGTAGYFLMSNGSGTAPTWVNSSSVSSAGGWTDDGSVVRLTTINDSVGIGITTPSSSLHVNNGGFLVTGTTGATTVAGAGTRLMWIPSKYSFRAGRISGSQWDDSNIGSDSVAFGLNNIARGTYTFVGSGSTNAANASYSSVVGGSNNTATGTYAFVGGGSNNTASGTNSFVGGGANNVSGNDYSVVDGGRNNNATGQYSAIVGGRYNDATGAYSFIGGGYDNNASGLNSVAFGRYLTVSGDYSFGVNVNDDGVPITVSQSKTIALLGGNVGVGTVSPDYLLTVAGDINVTGTYYQNGVPIGSPAGSNTEIQFNDSGAFGATNTFVWDNINRRMGIGPSAPEFALTLSGDGGIMATGSFGAGATLATSGEGTRMFWYPRKAAFRAGQVQDGEWDNANIGDYSVAHGLNNKSSGSYSFIGGGNANWAVGTSSFIGNGFNHLASGEYSFIGNGDGLGHQAIGFQSFIGNGTQNEAYSSQSFIGNGYDNVASGTYSFIGSGREIEASGNSAVIVSGYINKIYASNYAFIGTGDFNSVTGTYAAIVSGNQNKINGESSFIGTGDRNYASGSYAYIGTGSTNTSSAWYATVVNGASNIASGPTSFIGNGEGNKAAGELSFVGNGRLNYALGYGSAVVGGEYNKANSDYSFVGGGDFNVASNTYAVVVGGTYNTASGTNSFVGGGTRNIASGANSFIGGGFENWAYGGTSFAAGYQNRANGTVSMALGTSMTVSGNYSFGVNVSTTAATLSQNNAIALLGGNVGIGDASPVSLLTVGNGDLFQVDLNGNIIKINNVTTNWPSSQGAAGTILRNDGSGNLSWVATTSLGFASTTHIHDAADIASGVLAIARGGTNASSIGSAGTIAYSNGTGYAFSAVGNVGDVMLSGGSGAPTWVASTTFASSTHTHGSMISGSGSAFRLAFWDGANSVSSTSLLTYVPSNNALGIGTTTPSQRLDLVGADGNGAVRVGNTVTSTNGSIRFSTSTGDFEGYDGTAWRSMTSLASVRNEATGFPNITDTSISFVTSTRTFTINPTGASFKIYSNGSTVTKTGSESITIPNTTGEYFIYYTSAGVLTTSTTAWDINSSNIPVATLYWNATDQIGLLGEERHGLVMDGKTHAYLHKTVGTRYESGLSLTADNTRATTTAGVIWDEDLKHEITEQTQFQVLYRGTGGTMRIVAKQNAYYLTTGGNLAYDDGSGTLQAAPSNQYVNYWFYATNNTGTVASAPVFVLVGQRTHGTLASAQAENYSDLSLSNLPLPEYKIIYRVTLRNTGATPTWIQNTDLRSVTNLPSGTYVATAHSVLTGLSFDTAGHTGFAGTGVENTFTATNTFSSTNTIFHNVLPETSLLYTLGNSASRWSELWAATVNYGTSTWSITASTTNGRLGFFDAASGGGTERLTIATNGNIGIGSSSPNYKLDVNGDINVASANTFRIGGADIGQYFINSAGTSGQLWASDGDGRGNWINTSSLGLASAGGWTDDGTAVRLTASSDYVGIGTTTPPSTLSVAAAGSQGIGLYGSTNGYLLGGLGSTGNNLGGLFALGYNNTTTIYFGSRPDTGTSYVGSDGSTMKFGINTSSPSSALSVNGTTTLAGALNLSNGPGAVGNIMYSNGASAAPSWLAQSAISAGYVLMSNGAAAPSWVSSTSLHSAAGWTDDGTAVRLTTASDNVGIGTSTPTSKLYIRTNTSGDGIFLSALTDNQIAAKLNFTTVSAIRSAGNLYLMDNNVTTTLITAYGNSYIQGGNLGIGTTTPGYSLTVSGDTNLTGSLRTNGSAGTNGQVLQSTGTGLTWASTSSLIGTLGTMAYQNSNSVSISGGTITGITDLAIADGGTNTSTIGSAGTIAYSNGSSYNFTAVGTAGYLLMSNGSGVPTWVNSTTFASGGGWTDDGTTVRLTTVTDNVGIGTASVNDKLDVAGNIDISAGGYFKYNNTNFASASTTLQNNFFGTEAGSLSATGFRNTGVGNEALKELRAGAENTAVGFQSMKSSFSGVSGQQNTSIGAFSLTDLTSGSYNTAVGYGSEGNITSGINNTAVGYYTLAYNTVGAANTAVGNSALYFNEAASNTAVGYESLYSNVSSVGLTALGYQALRINTTGGNNTAVGYQSLYTNSGGSNNVALGKGSLQLNVNGSANVAVGNNALYSNTVASNTAVGYEALNRNTTGNYNTANGYMALRSNATGFSNTAVGSRALYSNDSYGNSAFGDLALYYNSSGHENSAFGGAALYNNTSGNFNTAMGSAASLLNTTGEYNTAFGEEALKSATSSWANVAVGAQALMNNTAASNTAVGFQAMYTNTTGIYNTAFGYNALYKNLNGEGNTGVGYAALYSNDAGDYNTAIGFGTLMLSTADSNTAIGYGVMPYSTTGVGNTALGRAAMRDNTIGSYNVALGNRTLLNNTSSFANVAVGYEALRTNIVASNTAVGYQALYSNVGSSWEGVQNTAVGYRALRGNTSGYNNTAVGYEALSAQTTATHNSAFGANALRNQMTGGSNSAFGSGALYSSTSTSGNDAFGNGTMAYLVNGVGNIALGGSAMYATAIGSYNTAVGGTALGVINNGNSNVAVGANAMANVGSGNYNSVLGFQALGLTTATTSANVAIGYQALRDTTVSSNTAIGYKAMFTNTNGRENTALGYEALTDNLAGFYNTAVGHEALATNYTGMLNVGIGWDALSLNYGGSGNTAVGSAALGTVSADANTAVGYAALSQSYAASNTAVGYSALVNNSTGYENTALGYKTLYTNTSSYSLTALGYAALYGNTSGYGNVGVGTNALTDNTSGHYNTALGDETLANMTTGNFNTALGRGALYTATAGDSNVAIGMSSMYDASSGANYNTALGSYSAENITTGDYNTVIGYQAGATLNGSLYNTLIGYGADLGSNAVDGATAVGQGTNVSGDYGVALGYGASANLSYSVAIGYGAVASTTYDIYLGNINADVVYWKEKAANYYLCIGATGIISSQSAACSGSDEQLKTDVTTISASLDVLDALKSLRGVYYYWDNTKPGYESATTARRLGMIAQEVQAVLPELVETGDDGFYQLDYDHYVGYLTEVAKAQQNIIEPIDTALDVVTSTRSMTVGSVSEPYTLNLTGNVNFLSSSDSDAYGHKLSFSTSTTFESSVSSTAGSRAFIFNALNFSTSSADNYILSLRSNNSPAFSVSANGDVHAFGNMYAASAVLGTSTNPGDLAEKVDINPSETVESGDVMMVDPASADRYQKTNTAYEPTVAGVISTNPTIIVGNGKTSQTAPLAMVGRVPVKYSLESGEILRGDLLVSASESGKAMRYDPRNDDSRKVVGIIGVALENSADSMDGKVMTLIRTGWVYNKTEAAAKLEQQVQIIAAETGVDIGTVPEELSVGGTSGSITYSGAGDLNLSGNAILNVTRITGKDNLWSIDENGLLISKVTTSQGEKNIYGMASESAEITISGTGTLQMGEAVITFATDTQEIIDGAASIKVNVTLTSIEAKGVAVVEKTVQGFKVKELDGGTSNATFDWMVIAKRKISNESINVDDSVMTPETTGGEGGVTAPLSPSGDPAPTDPVVETPPAEETTPPADPVVETPPAEETTPPDEPIVETPPAEETTPPADPVVETPPAEETAPPAEETTP